MPTTEDTQTSTTETLPFDQGEVTKLPDLICLGRVASVETPTEARTAKGLDVIVQQVKLTAVGAGRPAVAFLRYMPSWLAPGFRADSFKNLPENLRAGAQFMYNNVVVPPRGSRGDRTGIPQLSALQGLSSSPERFVALANQLRVDNQTADNVYAILKAFIVGQPVGYILRQSSRKDDAGNKYLTDNYEISAWYYPTKENAATLREYARKNPEKAKVTFEV